MHYLVLDYRKLFNIEHKMNLFEPRGRSVTFIKGVSPDEWCPKYMKRYKINCKLAPGVAGDRLLHSTPKQPTEGFISKPLRLPIFAETPHIRMVDPGGLRPPGPEPGFEGFEIQRKAQVGKEVWNQELAKTLLGADSKNLKMRRLQPTDLPTLS